MQPLRLRLLRPESFGPKKQLLSTDVLYNSSYVNNAGELIVSTGEYQTDHLGQQAIAQIEAAKRASKPFCAPRGALFLCASGTARGLTDAGGVQTSTSRPWRRTPRRATIRGRSR